MTHGAESPVVDPGLRPFWNWSSISLETRDSGARSLINTTDTACRGLVLPYDFTVLLSVGCTVGVLIGLYIIIRAYKLMFLSYCVSLSHQTDETDRPPPAVCRLPRARSSRGKGLTPPPPYDSPPPYHVAIVMCAGDTAISPVIPAEVHISEPVYI